MSTSTTAPLRHVKSAPPPAAQAWRQRVEAVGPKRFGIVAIDVAKRESRWRLADFYGHIIVTPTTLPHRRRELDAAVQAITQARQDHQLGDLIVVLERTGRYHLPLKRHFAAAGLDVRIVDPLATHQFRKPVQAGTKTDDIDLQAIQDAAVHGLGMAPVPTPPVFLQLRDWARHRRDLVTKATRLRCQILEHLHDLMPGYADCFDDVFHSRLALFVPLHFPTAAAVRAAGVERLAQAATAAQVRFLARTVETVVAWAELASDTEPCPAIRQAILADLVADGHAKRQQIAAAEAALAGLLARTPYLVLLSMPGLNVVTTAEFAGEAGPMTADASGRAITGRAGLYPSRYQSGPVDRRDGPLVPKGNRRLRQAILRIADTLIRANDHFRLKAWVGHLAGMPREKLHIVVGGRFARIAFRMVAGGQTYRHPGSRDRDSIIAKLMKFCTNHSIDIQETMSILQTAVDHLPPKSHLAEVPPLAAERTRVAGKRGAGPTRLSEILPPVLARLQALALESESSGELSRPV